jgi:hypothetical protein
MVKVPINYAGFPACCGAATIASIGRQWAYDKDGRIISNGTGGYKLEDAEAYQTRLREVEARVEAASRNMVIGIVTNQMLWEKEQLELAGYTCLNPTGVSNVNGGNLLYIMMRDIRKKRAA